MAGFLSRHRYSSDTHAVGIYVTKQAVRVVVLEDVGDTYRVVERFVRTRGMEKAGAGGEEGVFAGESMEGNVSFGGAEEEFADDYSIEFDDEGSGGGFPGSDFSDKGQDWPADDAEEDASQPDGRVAAFAPVLREIVEHCQDKYGKQFGVAYCVGPPDISCTYVDEEDLKTTTGSKHQKKLLKRLNKEQEQKYTADQVVFMPLVGTSDSQSIAVIRDEQDSVTSTLRTMHRRYLRSLPVMRLLESEVTLFPGLALGDGAAAETNRRTAILRVGTEDTLVVFLENQRLWYQEYLQSLTTREASDTICSRLLLQQDEAGIAAVDRIFVAAEEREAKLIERLTEYYPEAEVLSFQEQFRHLGIEFEALNKEEALSTWMPAVGVALRLFQQARGAGLETVNLMPRKLRRRKATVQLAWHTVTVAGLLFVLALLFVSRYYQHQQQVEQLKHQIAQYPTTLQLTEEQLQARIDSLAKVHATYADALVRLDTVLEGSDRWSRMMAQTVRHTGDIPGIWVESWQPRQQEVQLKGYALQQNRVVRLANQLGAEIDVVTSDAIREQPVFKYSLTAPLPSDLPLFMQYLRKQHAENKLAEEVASIP